MDFKLSQEHLMARDLFRSFAENEVKPLAQEVDEEERFPVETIEKMGKLGFMGIPIPKEYGGQGCDYLTYAICVEELAKVCGTTAVILSAHTSLCQMPILHFGTEAQKQKYLVPLAKGETLGAFGLTEPGAGTDASGQHTKAVLDGDEYVLNGSKVFITNGYYADTYVIFAMTNKELGNKGISAFIVEKGTPGFTFGTKEKKMGIRGSATYELVFTDCRIPKENLLGRPQHLKRRPRGYCRTGTGPGSRRTGSFHRLRQDPQAVRQDAGPFPEHPVHLSRYGNPHRSSPPAGLPGGH